MITVACLMWECPRRCHKISLVQNAASSTLPGTSRFVLIISVWQALRWLPNPNCFHANSRGWLWPIKDLHVDRDWEPRGSSLAGCHWQEMLDWCPSGRISSVVTLQSVEPAWFRLCTSLGGTWRQSYMDGLLTFPCDGFILLSLDYQSNIVFGGLVVYWIVL